MIMNEIMRQEHEAIMEWCHDICDDHDEVHIVGMEPATDNLREQLELPIDSPDLHEHEEFIPCVDSACTACENCCYDFEDSYVNTRFAEMLATM
jgi:hypothetical protein|tara:strand:+ start:1061 stop:1342 length:282 start_codon:yes stop_codon:yes gene_type:complete